MTADNGLSLGCGTTVDGYVLTDEVVITYFGRCLFADKLQVLRDGTDDGSGENLIAVADAGTIKDGNVRHDNIVIADDYILVDEAERPDLYVLSDLCFRINIC